VFEWVKLLHIGAALAFVAAHGASMAVLYVIRRQSERSRIVASLDLASGTTVPMYVALLAVVGTGFWMAFLEASLFEERWFWAALILLVLTGVLMFFLAKPFAERIRDACAIRESGVPRVSDQELSEILRSTRTYVITAIGVIGLAVVLYLMMFQPAMGGATTSAEPPADPAVLVLGQQVYEGSAESVGCAQCHGIDAMGEGSAPAIAGVSRARIEAGLDHVLAMRDIDLSPDEFEAVYQYLQTLK
jgi:Predicted integral membrane protein (DUF2269)